METFEDNFGKHSDGIILPDISPVEVDRREDLHKPSIFDIEGALKILEDEENGNIDAGDDEPTLQ